MNGSRCPVSSRWGEKRLEASKGTHGKDLRRQRELRRKLLVCPLILHGFQEPPTDRRIDPVGLRQRPLAPLFDLVHRRGTVACHRQSDDLDVLPNLASLLKRRRIPEKPVNSSLLDALLPFFLYALGFKP